MSPKIEALIKQAPEKLAGLLEEAADQLEEAIVAAAAEAQAQETAAKLNVGFAMKIDLDKNAVEYAVSWSVRHTLSESVKLPDPNQPDLPGTTVTFSTEGVDPVTLTDKDLRRAARVLNSKA